MRHASTPSRSAADIGLGILVTAFAFAVGLGAPCLAGAPLEPEFFHQDQDALLAFHEKYEGKTIEALIRMPEPVDAGLPAPLLKGHPPAQDKLFRLSGHCFLAVRGNLYDRKRGEVPPGRFARVSGRLESFEVGRQRTGKLIWVFCLDASGLEPAVVMTPLSAPAAFNPGAYPPLDTEKLIDKMHYWEGRKLHIQVDFAGPGEVNTALAEGLGIHPKKWRMLRHTSSGGRPLLLLPATAVFDWNAIKSMAPGSRLHIYGQAFLLLSEERIQPGMLVDGASPQPIGKDDPLLHPDAEAEEGAPDKRFPRIRKDLLREIVGGVYKGIFPQYKESGRRAEIAFVYRGHMPNRSEEIERIPELQSGKYFQLPTNDNQLGRNIRIVAPDDKETQEKLGGIERGDTIILRCRIHQIDEQTYCLEAMEIEIPPIQHG